MGLLAFIAYIIIFAFLFLLLMGAFILSGLFGGIANFLRLFRLGNTLNQERSHQRTARSAAYSSSQASASGTNSASNGKIFSADEGVYVDFEEIKES